jgi:N-acetyl sugar amidotransferase
MKQYPVLDSDFYNQFIVESKSENYVKYGLPEQVTFCNKCVISNQRPNSAIETKHVSSTKKTTIEMNDEGVCDACITAENKKMIDWEQREEQLKELCNKYRKNDGSYDCLVPGSGGKDSFYASHLLKYKYGMNPLTITWAPHMYTDWGWHNFQSWIEAGHDNYLMTPNKRVHRLLTRLAVENLLHPFQPFMVGQKNLPPKIASLFNIPLVFYGEDEAEYGNPIADNKNAIRSTDYYAADNKEDLYLSGESYKGLLNDFGLEKVDLEPYLPIQREELIKKDITVQYLGYYLPWHPQGAYYYAVENGGFIPSPERTPGTYSKYNSIDDKIDDIHFYTLYMKFGIGRATYDSAQEVRNEEITREEAVSLVKKYDGEYPARFEKEIFNYLSIHEKEFPVASKMFEEPIMTKEYFFGLCDTFRSPHIWKNENNQWILRSTVFK